MCIGTPALKIFRQIFLGCCVVCYLGVTIGPTMIIESVAAAGAILSTISTAINKLNEVGDGAAKAVELMQGFSDALDSFEREKKDSVINNLSSQELLKLD